ncbi:MAG: hypothetical protein ACPHA6_12210 [Paracoccaceae bacterium]
MTKLKEFRKNFPQYDDLSDEQVMDGLHRNHYSDIPRDEFDKKMGYAPPRSASFAEQAVEGAEHLVRGFNKGLVNTIGLPYRGLDWLAEKATGGEGLPDFETLGWARPYVNQPRAKTYVGRLAQAGGEAVGASAIPQAALTRAAPALAALTPTTTSRAIGQTIGQQIARRPAAAAAIDAAAYAASGGSVKAAEEAGYGPAVQTVVGMAAGLLPGAVLAYRGGARQPQAGTDTMQTIARRRALAAQQDQQAFDRQGARQVGIAYNEGPIASVGKQLSETPLVGSPIRGNIEQSMEDAARASRQLASRINPTATAESAGNRVMGGLRRYQSSSFSDLEPGAVSRLGIEPNRPFNRAEFMSPNARRSIETADQRAPLLGADETQTTRGVNVPTAQTRDATFANRTGIEDLSDQQLATVIRADPTRTSFMSRQEALFERAFRMIPNRVRRDGSANPDLINPTNTRRALRAIQGNIASNITQQGTLQGPLADRLMNANANIMLGDLRAIRTEVGRALSNFNPIAAPTLDRSQLKQLYRAISQDIEIGLRTISARAINNASLPGANARGGVDPASARRGAGALRAFRTADRYMRQGMRRIESFYNVLNAKTAEQATSKLVRAALSGKRGDARLFRQGMAVLRPEERAEFASLIVREMGKPTDGAKGLVQDIDWSPNKFVTNYRAMSTEARQALFTEQHQRDLTDIYRIANRIANVEALANTSRSGTNTLNMGGAVLSVASGATGDIVTPMLIGGSGFATSFLMSRPTYARWMVQFLQMKAAFLEGTEQTVGPLLNHISGLRREAEINPALFPVIYAVTNDVNALADNKNPPELISSSN